MSRAMTMINRRTADSAGRNMREHEPIERPRQSLDHTAFGEPDQGEQPHNEPQQLFAIAFDGRSSSPCKRHRT